jgi:hypothetical protein
MPTGNEIVRRMPRARDDRLVVTTGSSQCAPPARPRRDAIARARTAGKRCSAAAKRGLVVTSRPADPRIGFRSP